MSGGIDFPQQNGADTPETGHGVIFNDLTDGWSVIDDAGDTQVIVMQTTQTVRIAAQVPSGAPIGSELPVALDSTAITGGLYVWDGAAWVQASVIP